MTRNRTDAAKGLYRKFRIERTDGSSGPGGKHEHCEYFVLDLVHDEYAHAALATYADQCERAFPQLYDDLQDILAKRPYRFCIGTPPWRKQRRDEGKSEDCTGAAVIALGNGVWFCVEHAPWYEEQEKRLGSGGLSRAGKDSLARRIARTPAP